MTLGSPIPAPQPADGRAPATADTGARPWCSVCNTDSYIFVETVVEAAPNQSEIVEVSYTCSECDTFYAHAVRLDALVPAIQSEFLSTSAAGLWFSCTHCGDPMTLGRPTERIIEAPRTTDDPESPSLLEVYLQTQVLHCRCGFQMEVPRHVG
ncbi:hypothetical protein [Paenarthrobacter aurescens]|nr:hypothetical protein [Paenarthrobacter aurescens]MDO6142005.1 hypothetical protein [Paenarthrobacter aurescens]MDO6145810.1 hypothetical protein [Paenarthrobacter aurescens]MDO6157054.1 hypothetical protein [Paenarthrobacter aurescens]MDO6161040.1 hypothetical protein [Paenarthrobacter aurescens]